MATNDDKGKARLLKELEAIKARIPQIENTVNENGFHELLKIWGKLVAVSFSIGLTCLMVGYIAISQYHFNLPNSVFNSIGIKFP